MLNKIIGFSIRNKLLVGLAVLALIGWGSYEVTKLPIDAVPDITDNQIQVITVSPSLGAPDVERLITVPVEQSCSNIAGLKQIRSFSRFGLSLVTIVFDDETDVYWARQQVSERLQQVKHLIPEGIGVPEMAPVTTGLGEIYQYVVRPKKGYEHRYDPTELRTIQDWMVRRQLLGTPGVAEVSSFGGKLKQYEIAVRPEQLKAYDLSVADVFDALEKNNENTGGAYIEKGPTVLYIRSEGLTKDIDDIGHIVVKAVNGGMPVLMRDIATIQYGSAIRYGAMTYNTEGEVAGAVVMMLKGENSSAVVRRVKEKIAQIQHSLPEGVVIEPFLDRTKMVNHAIQTVETNLMEGALIVVFVLIFFLGNLRAGLIVSSVIPLSMLFAIILMNQFGVGGNLMSLGAIDFGLIVDGSVIVVEAILHRFTHSKDFRAITRIDQPTMDHEVKSASGAMIKSAAFSQVIILIVYLPILSLQGIEGKMFKPMAFTIAFAILGAFILSVTYVPMMSALFLSKKLNHKKTWSDKMTIWLQRRYQPLLRKAMRIPKTLILATLGLFVIAVILLGRMGGEFIPELEEGDFAVETRLLMGSNLNATIAATQKTTGILLEKFPEVEKVVTKIGSAEIPTDPMPFEAGDMIVVLKDKSEWTSAGSFDELAEKMTKELSVVPGVTVGFQFPVQMRFNELMTGARQDVVCKIFGENLDTLARYAQKLHDVVRTVDGAINIYVESVTGMPQVVVKYNREAMASYGLNVRDINRVVNTAFAGQVAGTVYEGEKRFDLVVRLAGDKRRNLDDVKDLLIPVGNGTQIPLQYVAKVEEVESINQVQRENTSRRIIVGFNVQGRDVQSIVKEVQQKVSDQVRMPAGYSLVYGGSFENMTAAKDRLSIVVPIALLLIFLLLYFAFNSVKQGLLIYTAIPLSAIGGIFALWLRDMPFSISAGVGFIALFGVAVLNGILIVSEFNRLRKEGWSDVRRIVIHATRSKLRAVLMTALVPSLGFIPMAISTGAGGEVQKPLATVVIGGLLISTLLTLFVLPVLYILFEKGFKFFKPPKPIALLLCMIPLFALSQDTITLQEAINKVKSHPGLQLLRMEEKYNQALVGTAFDIEQTMIGGEYGKLNSWANDSKLMISQSFAFPTVYSRQAKLNKDVARLSELTTKERELELVTEVKLLFYTLIVLRERQDLLRYADSLYKGFADRAALRLKAGESDILEKVTADNQRLQIANQLQELEVDMTEYENQFRWLLQADSIVKPMAASSVYDLSSIPQFANIDNNPVLLAAVQQLQISQSKLKVEKAKLLPSIEAGYNNMSIIGWQKVNATDEVYFGSGKRFGSVSAGVGIPIFHKAQRSRIKAAGIGIRQQETGLAMTKKKLQQELSNKTAILNLSRQQIQTFKDVTLPNADLILQTVSRRLNAGEITYLDWVILTNQALQVRGEYLTAVQRHNEAAISLEKFSQTTN
jgi:cobalt-zinc-cadmium resistance protein CzcA